MGTTVDNGRWQGEMDAMVRSLQDSVARIMDSDVRNQAQWAKDLAVIRTEINGLKVRLAVLCALFSTVGGIIGGIATRAFGSVLGGG